MPPCRHCRKVLPQVHLSGGSNLCKPCRRRFPPIPCVYCRTEFHMFRNDVDKDTAVCLDCEAYFRQYGKPSVCDYCGLRAAFQGRLCERCNDSAQKYGNPVVCQECGRQCAFIKSEEKRQKVDGKILCILCTLEYKRRRHKRERKRRGSETLQINSSSKKVKSTSSRTENKPLEVKQNAQFDLIVTATSVYQLKEEVSEVKKSVQKKNQELLKKDKEICELKAQLAEEERSHRQKVVQLQKEYQERCDDLQGQLRSLQRQNGKKTC